MTTFMAWFDFITALTWFLLAAVGIILRLRRLVRLYRVVLPEPVAAADVAYLASIKRSTYLRLAVKVVFLIGSLIALFNLPLFGVWRIGVILALVFMIAETVGVDAIRDRLGRTAQEAG